MNHYVRTTGSSKRSWSIARAIDSVIGRDLGWHEEKPEREKARERKMECRGWAYKLNRTGGAGVLSHGAKYNGRSVSLFVNERKSARRAIVLKAPLRANLHELLKRRDRFFFDTRVLSLDATHIRTATFFSFLHILRAGTWVTFNTDHFDDRCSDSRNRISFSPLISVFPELMSIRNCARLIYLAIFMLKMKIFTDIFVFDFLEVSVIKNIFLNIFLKLFIWKCLCWGWGIRNIRQISNACHSWWSICWCTYDFPFNFNVGFSKTCAIIRII